METYQSPSILESIVPHMAHCGKQNKVVKIQLHATHDDWVSNLSLTYKALFTIVQNSFKNDLYGDGYVRSN